MSAARCWLGRVLQVSEAPKMADGGYEPDNSERRVSIVCMSSPRVVGATVVSTDFKNASTHDSYWMSATSQRFCKAAIEIAFSDIDCADAAARGMFVSSATGVRRLARTSGQVSCCARPDERGDGRASACTRRFQPALQQRRDHAIAVMMRVF